MPRKKDLPYNTDGDVFATRLREVMEERGINQTQLSALLLEKYDHSMQRQTISLYMNGQSKPDTERLTLLCKALNVSADYLLGLAEHETPNEDMRAMCEYTGLSEEALDVLFIGACLKSIQGRGYSVFDDLLKKYGLRLNHALVDLWDSTESAKDFLNNLSREPSNNAFTGFETFESVSQEVELSVFRLSKICNEILDIFGSSDILYRLEDEESERWDTLGNPVNNGNLLLSKLQDATPLSARNIPSTAVEAQSGTPGGDPSPIEEIQDGKYKEDKR